MEETGAAGRERQGSGRSAGLVTRQSDLRPQDHLERGFVEDFFTDLHLGRPIHPGQDGGITWGNRIPWVTRSIQALLWLCKLLNPINYC